MGGDKSKKRNKEKRVKKGRKEKRPAKEKKVKVTKKRLGQGGSGEHKKDIATLIKGVKKDMEKDGQMEVKLGAVPAMTATTQELRPNMTTASYYSYSCMGALLRRVGAPVLDDPVFSIDWNNLAAYVSNKFGAAMSDTIDLVKEAPTSLKYILDILNPKVSEPEVHRRVNFYFKASGTGAIPPPITDGSPLVGDTGFGTLGTFFSPAATGFKYTYGVPTTTSQFASGNLCTIAATATVFDETQAEADLGLLSAYFDKSKFAKMSKSKVRGFDTDSCTDAYNPSVDPVWAFPLQQTNFGFQRQVTHTGPLRDVAIAECCFSQPTTATTPSTATGTQTTPLGPPLAGFEKLVTLSGIGGKDARSMISRPAPYDLAELLNVICKTLAGHIQIAYNGDTSSIPTGLLNTTELYLIMLNFMIPFFNQGNHFGGASFPSPIGTNSQIGLSIDMKNYPTAATSGIKMPSLIVENLRAVSNLTINRMKEDKKKRILRCPVIIGDSSFDYSAQLRAGLVTGGMSAAEALRIFPDAPTVATLGRITGKYEAFSGSWAQTSPSVSCQAVNISQGGVIQKIISIWNLFTNSLGSAGCYSAGDQSNDATTNRVLLIKTVGEDDVPQNPISTRSTTSLRIMAEVDYRKEAPSEEMGVNKLYFEHRIIPSIYIGVLGTTAYGLENYQASWGFPNYLATGGQAEETKAVFLQSLFASTPMRGLPSTEDSSSEMAILWHMAGGGLVWDPKQMELASKIIKDAPDDVKKILEEFQSHKPPFPKAFLIALAKKGKNTASAIEVLKKRLRWNKFKDGVGHFLKDAWDIGKKLLPDLIA
jgi:hypothetical protein